MYNDWIETSQEELDEFNSYYRYVESLIAIEENLPEGRFSQEFEYSFCKRKNGKNIVSYFEISRKGKRRKSDIRQIEVIPFDIWKIREKRSKLLDMLGI
jgi:hypothetical protein